MSYRPPDAARMAVNQSGVTECAMLSVAKGYAPDEVVGVQKSRWQGTN